MTAPAAELQKAVFSALENDAGLLAALGKVRIFAHAPEKVAFPYITFGRTSVYDWSTGTEKGSEHLFTLHIWSKATGNREVLEIMELIRARLDEKSLPLESHRLVSLRLEFCEERFHEDLAVLHGLLRFRALVEAPQE